MFPNLTGEQVIMRTDLMFERIGGGPLSCNLDYTKDEDYISAEALFQESIALQDAGNPQQSTQKFMAASVHSEAYSPVCIHPCVFTRVCPCHVYDINLPVPFAKSSAGVVVITPHLISCGLIGVAYWADYCGRIT